MKKAEKNQLKTVERPKIEFTISAEMTNYNNNNWKRMKMFHLLLNS